MGYGDQLIATGLASGAARRGKRIAFGPNNGGRTCWDVFSAEIFKGNPNIAAPGTEGQPDVEWIDYRKGNRLYNRISPDGNRWIWNEDFHPKPGELYFDEAESKAGYRAGSGFILIEPNVDRRKRSAVNKDWGFDRYQTLVTMLLEAGLPVVQFAYPGALSLTGPKIVPTKSFRDALNVMQWARCYVGPEGGMHHGAAALGIQAVVIFGGFASPGATGYYGHVNLTGGVEKPCGALYPCQHCRDALKRITVSDVFQAVLICSS